MLIISKYFAFALLLFKIKAWPLDEKNTIKRIENLERAYAHQVNVLETMNKKLNKKVKQLARKSVLADKAQGQNLIIVEDFTFEAPKTKEFINILNNLNASGKSLFVTAEQDNVLYKSGRNVPASGVVTAQNVNTYEIINANTLILSESSVAAIAGTFA